MADFVTCKFGKATLLNASKMVVLLPMYRISLALILWRLILRTSILKIMNTNISICTSLWSTTKLLIGAIVCFFENNLTNCRNSSSIAQSVHEPLTVLQKSIEFLAGNGENDDSTLPAKTDATSSNVSITKFVLDNEEDTFLPLFLLQIMKKKTFERLLIIPTM